MLSDPRTRTRPIRAHLLTLACTPLLALSLFPANPLRADAIWTATGSGLWSTATNWSTNPLIPNGQDQNVLFSNSTTAVSLVTLSTPITVGGLAFDSAFSYALAAPAANLTLSTSTGNATITVNHSFANVTNTISAPIIFASPTAITNNDLPATDALTLSGALSGSAPLTFNGPGQVTLSGNNFGYIGTITINNGTLFASSSSALGCSTSIADGTTINTGGMLVMNSPATIPNEFITLNGGTLKVSTTSVQINGLLNITADSIFTASTHTSILVSSLVGTSNLTLSTAAFTLSGVAANTTFSGTLNLTAGSSTNLTASLINAQISVGSGASFTFVRPVGTSPTVNSVTPGSVVVTGGEIGVSADIDFRPALAANATLSGILFNTNNATLGGSNSLDMNTFNNPSSLRIGGTGSIAPTMTLRPDLATHTYRFGLSDTPSALTVNATLTDHDAAPNNLDINGGATTLSANNTFSGTTTIANGTLLITNPNALGTASGTDADSTIINANGTLKLAANVTLTNEKITVNPGGTLTANNNSTAIYANPITMNGGALGNAAYTGTISGTSDFNVGGGAVLAGTGLYSGNLTLIGNATVTNASALNASSSTIIEFGAVLRLFQPVSSPLEIRNGTVFLGAGVALTTAPITVLAGTLSAASSTGIYASPINIAGNATLASGTFTGQLNGAANFTASGATLAGTGNYAGILTINGPTIIAGPNALSAAGTNIIAAGNVTISSAVTAPFQITGGNVTMTAAVAGPVNFSNGTIILANNASVTSPITVSKGQFIGNGTFTSTLTITGTASLGAGNFANNPSSLSFNDGLVGNGNVSISDLVFSGDKTPHFIINGTSAINNLQLSAGSFEFAGSTTVNGSTNLGGGFSIFTGSTHFVGPFTTNASNGSMQSGTFDSAVTLNSSPFAFSGTTIFHGPLTFTGAGNTISFAGATTFDLPLTINAQTILFQNNTTLPGLSLAGGTLTTAPNATVTSITPITLLNGTLGASLSAPALVKTGFGNVTVNDIGPSLSPIAIDQGAYIAYTLNQPSTSSPLGATANTVTVAPTNAVLSFWGYTNTTLAAPAIHLQNSTGVLFRGGLTGYSIPVIIENPVDLGSVGSIIGAQLSNGTMRFDGVLSGGSLTVDGNVSLTNPSNNYSGSTILTPLPIISLGNIASPVSLSAGYLSNDPGLLQAMTLSNGGRILQTSAITINRSTDLTLNESSIGAPVDALPDSVPIILNGGRIAATFETAGTLTFGVSNSDVVPLGNGSLTFQSLVRQPGATAFFDIGASYSFSHPGQLLFATAPALTNGILGGWAVTNLYSPNFNIGLIGQTFATYGATGVVPLANTTGLLNAGPDDNVGPGGGTLTADRTINSIYGGNIDLAGHALTIKSGGFILSGTLSNGSVTVGDPGTGGELFLYTGTSSATASANIVDNASGSVSLVKAGRFALSLSGVNTYSGPTVVNEGTLYIDSPSALPAGNVLKVNGGILDIDWNDPSTTIQLGSLELRQNGFVSAVTTSAKLSNTALNANSYLIESGTFVARLIGNGPMQKTTSGTAFIGLTSNEYSGSIDVSQGVLVAAFSTTALGNSVVRVHAGAYLVNNIVTLNNPIELAGDLSGSSTNSLTTKSGSVFFNGAITVNGPATITTFDTLANLDTVGPPQILTFGGIVTIQPGMSLTSVANGTLQFNGGIVNNGMLSITDGSSTAAGITGNGVLNLMGTTSLKLTNTGANRVSALTLAGSISAWTSSFDLGGTKLIIQSVTKAAAFGAAQNQIAFGRSHSAGIFSSTLPVNTALALLDNAVTNFSTFGGLPVDANSLLIAPELIGDANADGHIDLTDLNAVLNHLGKTDPNWTSGNFDNQPTIDLTDLNAVLNNLGTTFANNGASLAPPAPSPEPTSFLLAFLAGLPLLTRRRRPF